MEKTAIRWAVEGEPSLLVLSVPEELTTNQQQIRCYAIPVKKRQGGLLLAIPLGAISQDKLIDELAADGEELLGPSKSFTSGLIQEKEDGTGVEVVASGCRFYIVDFTDEILIYLKEYEAADEMDGEIMAYEITLPLAVPNLEDIHDQVVQWAGQQHVGRAHFYSAREDPNPPTPPVSTPVNKKAAPKRITNTAIMQQLSELASRVDALAMAQAAPNPTDTPSRPPVKLQGQNLGGALMTPKMPSLSEAFAGQHAVGTPSLDLVQKAMSLAGPPPKVRAYGQPPLGQVPLPEDEPKKWQETIGQASVDPMLQALSQQSSALTALVAHLASSSDPVGELSSSSTSMSSSTKGVQRRERLQNELASGQSQFFPAVQQQLHRRLFPGRPVPRNLQEIQASGVSMLHYLERYGGYRNQRELGLCLWILGHVIDSMAMGDYTAKPRSMRFS